jgi:hypothetical protein
VKTKKASTAALPRAFFKLLLCGAAAALSAAPGTANGALGNYPNTTLQLGANTIVTPDAAPTTTTSINVSTTTDFKGKLEGDPTTGVVRVTDAHPAGIYTVTVKAFSSGGVTAMKMFTLTVTTVVACNPISFKGAASFATGAGPYAVAVGDFNRDGKQDLAVANVNADSVSILLGNGAGGFSAAQNFAVGSQPTSVAVGDLNGDGKQDLAVANINADSVSILLSNGAGGFSAAQNFAVGSQPSSVAVGDFNGDGKEDLAVTSESSNSVSVLLGNGAGGFAAAINNFPVGANPTSLAVGDFNGNGLQDLAVANSGSASVSVLFGDGTGSFGAPINSATNSSAQSVAIGDFDGDGTQFLAVANGGSGKVSVLLNNGGGNFSTATNFAAGAGPRAVAIGDIDGNGRQDLIVANAGSNNVSVLVGNGAGGFGPALNFNVGENPSSVAVGDFNGDGALDLVTTNEAGNNVSVLLRQCLPSPGQLQFNSPTYSVNENGGSVTITVTRMAGNDGPVSVDYATSDETATAGQDYKTSSGTLNFANGQTSMTFAVPVLDDMLDEADETVALTLSNPTGGAILGMTSAATLTIIDNDPPPALSINDVAVAEGNSGPTNTVFTVTLSVASGRTVTVQYATADRTATAGSDYVATSGTLTFDPGQTSKTITVLVNGDTNFEPDETFTVHLSNASNATIAVADGKGTIVNDDPAPSFSIDNVTQYEGNAGTTPYVFTVTKTGSTAVSATVSFATQDGTATTADNDYQSSAGTLAFAPTDTSKTITVLVNGDTLMEPDETFTVHLGNANNASIAIGDGTGTIANDDPTPPPAQLLNISTRAQVQMGDSVLIGGFIITGDQPKKIILRAIGPSLKANGQPIPGAMQDPTLELRDQEGMVVTNDNWKTDDQTQQSQQAEIEATGIAPTDDRESALVRTLSHGNYTVVLRGKDNSMGIAVVEAYDRDSFTMAKLANISSRGLVQSGDNVLIGGFIAGPFNAANTRVVVRGIGPSLARAGLTNVLADPTLELHDGNGVPLLANDNWKDGAQAQEIKAMGLSPSDDRESALAITLPPGAYTAVVAGKNGAIGIGLVEIYNLQPTSGGTNAASAAR